MLDASSHGRVQFQWDTILPAVCPRLATHYPTHICEVVAFKPVVTFKSLAQDVDTSPMLQVVLACITVVVFKEATCNQTVSALTSDTFNHAVGELVTVRYDHALETLQD